MPLLMCPNDNAQMTTMDRNGVQFDMCPTCRGVWLDRGELEKLMEGAAATAVPAYAPPPQQSQPWGRPQQQYREQPRYRDDDDYRYKKKKRDSIFDIFD